jgi:wyosine [tRNA(Phe)-imidazoG37] synthetase (radical SAM superfamily)
MLFNETIFGPIHSRRLGASLGVNLLPVNAKICSFDCIYCECGFNFTHEGAHIPTRSEVATLLEEKLKDLLAKGEPLDVITFAGNGEPTLHRDFNTIIDDTIRLRDCYFPKAKVSVLSNATRIHKPKVREALLKVDNNILKLDSAISATAKLINQPNNPTFSIDETIEQLKAFNGKLIIQTLFFTGDYKGQHIDNTTEIEVAAWFSAFDV